LVLAFVVTEIDRSGLANLLDAGPRAAASRRVVGSSFFGTDAETFSAEQISKLAALTELVGDCLKICTSVDLVREVAVTYRRLCSVQHAASQSRSGLLPTSGNHTTGIILSTGSSASSSSTARPAEQSTRAKNAYQFVLSAPFVPENDREATDYDAWRNLVRAPAPASRTFSS
ncbi:unnamed protein product, partial [Amoebophrya sp. A120]